MKRSVAVATDTDELGPCEPGTNVQLDGIVWQEMKEGMLILNVSWRGRTYVGALMDSTNHAWAPPRIKPVIGLNVAKPKASGTSGSKADGSNAVGHNIGERKLRNGKVTYKVNALAASSAAAATAAMTSLSSAPVSRAACRQSATSSVESTPSPTVPAASSFQDQGQKLGQAVTNSLRAEFSAAVTPLLLQCTTTGCFKKFKRADGLEYHRNFAHNSCSSGDHNRLPDNMIAISSEVDLDGCEDGSQTAINEVKSFDSDCSVDSATRPSSELLDNSLSHAASERLHDDKGSGSGNDSSVVMATVSFHPSPSSSSASQMMIDSIPLTSQCVQL